MYKGSLVANSLLLPQHHYHRHRHLKDAIPNRPPLDDLSSPKEVGELRSPKKHSGYQTSGPPYKGMILKLDSLPSSSGKRTAAPASSSWHATQHRHQTFVELRPPRFALGSPGPYTACPQLRTGYTSLRRPRPAGVQAPQQACLALSGSPPAKIKTNK